MNRGRTDSNQSAIVKALRKVGATVQILSDVGKGCPDLLVGFAGRTYAMEVKDGAKSPSERKLTPDQVKWHRAWKGQVAIVNSIVEALAVIGLNADAI